MLKTYIYDLTSLAFTFPCLQGFPHLHNEASFHRTWFDLYNFFVCPATCCLALSLFLVMQLMVSMLLFHPFHKFNTRGQIFILPPLLSFTMCYEAVLFSQQKWSAIDNILAILQIPDTISEQLQSSSACKQHGKEWQWMHCSKDLIGNPLARFWHSW